VLEGNDPRGRVFALILQAFRQLMCPQPGEFAHFFKKMLMPGGGGGGGPPGEPPFRGVEGVVGPQGVCFFRLFG